MTGTFGPAYDENLDGERIATQMERVRDLMLDAKWRTLGEIRSITRDPESSISAQLRHLRKARFGSYRVNRRRRTVTGLWEYQVLPPEPKTSQAQPELFNDDNVEDL